MQRRQGDPLAVGGTVALRCERFGALPNRLVKNRGFGDIVH